MKKKNRLANKISNLKQEIQGENSVRSDDKRKIKVDEKKYKDEIGKKAEEFKLNVIRRVFRISPAFKHPSFAEEKEWRLISTPYISGDEKTQFRVGESMIIPYINFDLQDKNKKMPINSVIVSPNPHPELSKLSAQDVLFKTGLKSCKIINSKIPYREL